MMMQGDDTISNSKGNVVSQAWKRLQQVWHLLTTIRST